MKKVIYLSDKYRVDKFEYSDLSELKSEFEKRNISIGKKVQIGYEARIGNYARIGYEAQIGSNAQIGYEARIGNYARIDNYARIGYEAQIGDNAQIGYEARIGYNTRIGDNARIGDKAQIGDNKTVKSICISGSKHSLIYWGEDKIQIGCKSYSISEWHNYYKSIGLEYGYSEEEISEYGKLIDLIEQIHISGIMCMTYNTQNIKS